MLAEIVNTGINYTSIVVTLITTIGTMVGVYLKYKHDKNKEELERKQWRGRSRMRVKPESFFKEMDRFPNQAFFVCTDTPSFLQDCIDHYGERIIYTERY